jgi:hypothetical protein
MKKKNKLIILIAIVFLVAATFYPGRSKQSAVKVLNSNDWIVSQHIDSQVKEDDITSFINLPFGVLVTTYEGNWFITFWDQVL